jgi:hypothetical protein
MKGGDSDKREHVIPGERSETRDLVTKERLLVLRSRLSAFGFGRDDVMFGSPCTSTG